MEVIRQLHGTVRFTHGEKAFRTHWIGIWVCTRSGTNAVDDRKSGIPAGNTEIDPPVIQLVT
jgi:hypothetical protein